VIGGAVVSISAALKNGTLFTFPWILSNFTTHLYLYTYAYHPCK
jgi:hypothetical protein